LKRKSADLSAKDWRERERERERECEVQTRAQKLIGSKALRSCHSESDDQ
jgi:hypothetical protein